MPVTLRESAKATGFSVATVSRALNGRSNLVSYETKQQILATAKELGYRPNLVGRSLRSACTNTIWLIVDNIASPFSPIVIRGIQDYQHRSAKFEASVFWRVCASRGRCFLSPCRPQSLVRHRRMHLQICAHGVIDNLVEI